MLHVASYMQKEDVADMYISKAEHLETQHKYKEAEQLYITVDEPCVVSVGCRGFLALFSFPISLPWRCSQGPRH